MSHALLKKFAIATMAAAPALAAPQTGTQAAPLDKEIHGRLIDRLPLVTMLEPRLGRAQAELSARSVHTLLGDLASESKLKNAGYNYDGYEAPRLPTGVARVFVAVSGTPNEPYYGCYQFRANGAPAATIEGVFSYGSAFNASGALTGTNFTVITPPANLPNCRAILSHLTGGQVGSTGGSPVAVVAGGTAAVAAPRPAAPNAP